MTLRGIVVTCMVSLSITVPGYGQELTIVCGNGFSPAGDRCWGAIARADSQQSKAITVQVMRGVAPVVGAKVRFRSVGGGELIVDTTSTDADGNARTVWMRDKGASPVLISVHASAPVGAGVKTIELRPNAPATTIVFGEIGGRDQSWFAENQLPAPIDVPLEQLTPTGPKDIDDESVCGAQRVAFSHYGGAGTVNPDTSVAELFETYESVQRRNSAERELRQLRKKGDSTSAEYRRLATAAASVSYGCFAWTNWTLGPKPAKRTIRATLVSAPGYEAKSPSTQIEATARALPAFIAGFVVTQNREFRGVKSGAKRTIKVEKLLPDGSKLIYDSTFTPSASVATQGGNVTGSGFAGVSLAIPPIPRFSFTGGVDLRSAADDWFAGMSLVRLAGPSAEALPLDAHLLLHVGRDDEIRNESSCAAGTAACKTEKVTRFQGLAFVLSADATSLLSELVKKLIP